MRISGYQLIERLEALRSRRTFFAEQLEAQKTHLPSAGVPDVMDTLRKLQAVDLRVVQVQELLARFNVASRVAIDGAAVTLTRAIQYAGAVRKQIQLLEPMSPTSKKNRSGYGGLYGVKKDEEYPVYSMSAEAVLETVEALKSKDSALRVLIRRANAAEIEFTDVSELPTV